VLTELTWFTKGLRRVPLSKWCSMCCSMGQNWPDLRRDCDPGDNGLLKIEQHDRIDLIYEGIATYKYMTRYAQRLQHMTELTWFTKGLRLNDIGGIYTYPASLTELTWFTKGLRLLLLSAHCARWFPDRIDLIYEGIATYIRILHRSRGAWTELTWFTKGLRPNYSLPAIP